MGAGVDTVFYIALWYGLNVGYNIYNKDLCNNFPHKTVGLAPLAWTVGTTSLGAGLMYMLPVWALGIRPIPRLDKGDAKKILVGNSYPPPLPRSVSLFQAPTYYVLLLLPPSPPTPPLPPPP